MRQEGISETDRKTRQSWTDDQVRYTLFIRCLYSGYHRSINYIRIHQKRSLCIDLNMHGLPTDEELPPGKKTGSARTSKKPKRRNAVHYDYWSGEQDPVNPSSSTSVEEQAQDTVNPTSSTGVEEHAQDTVNPSSPTGVEEQAQGFESGIGASPEFTEEMILPTASNTALESLISLEIQARDPSPDNPTAADGSFFFTDAQVTDSPPSGLGSPTLVGSPATSVEMLAHYEGGEEHMADDWPPENIRPNTQNLRYGGYPSQPAPQHRTTPLGSGRLQNTSKLGAFKIPVSRVL